MGFSLTDDWLTDWPTSWLDKSLISMMNSWMWVINQAWGQGWISAKTEMELRFINSIQNIQHPTILTDEGFIIWLLHVGHSRQDRTILPSQLQLRIWFILPTHRDSYMKIVLTTHACSTRNDCNIVANFTCLSKLNNIWSWHF